MAKEGTPAVQGNYISEWFGHRVFPSVAGGERALADQNTGRCPFLSDAVGRTLPCVKPASSKGVCSISSSSNRRRQDWLVCPHRALVPDLLEDVARRLFGSKKDLPPLMVSAPALAADSVRKKVEAGVAAGRTVAVYLQEKLGGEISVPRTDRSPEFSFDITLAQILRTSRGVAVSRYGILEVQTMDFHGSYREAVRNLTDGLRLHRKDFQKTIRERPDWLSQDIEGPNIANVFKRTFYQMIFKFRLAEHPSCAGCVLALPTAVWDSWQRHLGRPELQPRSDGTYLLRSDGGSSARRATTGSPAWIYVFEPAADSSTSPNPIRVERVIATDAEAVAHYALKVAADAAVGVGGAADALMGQVRDRLSRWWPSLHAPEPTPPDGIGQ